jgi:hypothetical protein
VSTLLIVFLFSNNIVAFAGMRTEKFKFPDVRDAFCGVEINYQYCKCAFHNQFCKNINLSRDSAAMYVWSNYTNWVRKKINVFARKCMKNNGIWSSYNRACTYCTSPDLRIGGRCVASEDADDVRSAIPEGPFNDDCVVSEEFDRDWEKYSDIDNRIETTSKSYEVQKYISTVEELVRKKVEAYNLRVEMEIDRRARLEMRKIRLALVQNIKTNLLKSFWRLSWITYNTVKSGVGTGKTYVEFLEKGATAEGVAKGIKVIQANVPGDSALALDTKTMSGKVRSVGANAALEALETLGKPTAVVAKMIDDSVKTILPSADITSEEIAILKDQNIQKRFLDAKIQESYLINSQRRSVLMALETEIARLEIDAVQWKQKEKNRVRDVLEKSCKDAVKDAQENK